MNAFKTWLKNFLARFQNQPQDLKSISARALAAVATEQDEVDEAARALQRKREEALANAGTILADLQAAKKVADDAEVINEAARVKTVEDFDKKTTAEVEALEEALRKLKERRAGEKATLEGELNTERTEATQQAEAEAAAELEIALAIGALQTGADAQTGLNDGLDA